MDEMKASTEVSGATGVKDPAQSIGYISPPPQTHHNPKQRLHKRILRWLECPQGDVHAFGPGVGSRIADAGVDYANRAQAEINKMAKSLGFRVIRQRPPQYNLFDLYCSRVGKPDKTEKKSDKDGDIDGPNPKRTRMSTSTKCGCQWSMKCYQLEEEIVIDGKTYIPGVYIVRYPNLGVGFKGHNHGLDVVEDLSTSSLSVAGNQSLMPTIDPSSPMAHFQASFVNFNHAAAMLPFYVELTGHLQAIEGIIVKHLSEKDGSQEPLAPAPNEENRSPAQEAQMMKPDQVPTSEV